MSEERDKNPMVVDAEVIQDNLPTRPMCTCCEPGQPLAISDTNPFAFCPAARKIYELQRTGGYAITDYVLNGPKIVDPKNGTTVFPRDEIPSQDELLSRAKENTGGSKPENTGPGRVDLGQADYY